MPDKSWDHTLIQHIIPNSNIVNGHISIDGKSLGRSYDKASFKSAIHMVRAWFSDFNCVLGQVKTKEKSNEIPAIPKLLEVLNIKNSVVIIDTMGTQQKTKNRGVCIEVE